MAARNSTPQQVGIALRTLTAILTAIAVGALLSWNTWDGTAAGARVIASTPWLAWRAVAAASVVSFMVLLAGGITLLRRPERELAGYSPATRNTFIVLALITVIVVGATVTLASAAVASVSRPLPVHLLGARTTGVLVVGAAAAVPWLALVWLVHRECRAISTTIASVDPPPLHQAVIRLHRLWELIARCGIAFTLFALPTLATTGILRTMALDTFPNHRNEFPASTVLLYGAPFIVFLLVLSLSMLAAWRSAAAQVLNKAVPIPIDLDLTEDWANRRNRLRTLLNLDVSLFRSPLTVLSTLVPLAVTLLAAFLPDLAAG
jgi:hypothetical protein